MRNIFSIKNKIVIITGAGRGIGHFLAKNMALNNAIVYAIDLKFSKLQNHTPNLFQIKCDIRQKTDIDKVSVKVSVKVYHARNWLLESKLWAEEAPNRDGGATRGQGR